jgi:HAD superfamily hydrolase (TIGR01484 family)
VVKSLRSGSLPAQIYRKKEKEKIMKLVAFDLDDTLAVVSHEIPRDIVSRLNLLSEKGMKFAICSGKPTYYIVGLARQCQFTDGIFIGENGASIQFGISLPPVEYYELPFDPGILNIFSEIKNKIWEKLNYGKDIWFQPNMAILTVFFNNENDQKAIAEVLAEYDETLKDKFARIFDNYDSFDIVPDGLSKGKALKFLASKLGIDKSDIIAVGNGDNDISMYENAGMSIGINQAYNGDNHRNAKSINEALDIIESIMKGVNI